MKKIDCKKINEVAYFSVVMLIIIGTIFYIAEICKLNKYLEDQEQMMLRTAATADSVRFDTSALESWCRGEDLGTLRMVGAWQAEGERKGKVEDEQGNRWNVIADYKDNDTLLLWVADNHTPQDASDDVVVKVWREA